MTNTRRCLLVVALACLVAPFPALALDSIGQVIAVAGQVSATGEDNKARILELKSDIFLNDKVVTAKGAKIQIMFSDDSVISEGESSELVIDQYVYSPKADKESSCSVKLAKGIFRVITGKITDMNPERFKVHTKMATIGIRGCQLGFRIRKDKEDVYVLDLPKGKTIVVQKTDTDLHGDLRNELERVLNIRVPGVAVTIEPGSAMTERSIKPFEARQILEDSTPMPPSGTKDTGAEGAGSGARTGAGVGIASALPDVKDIVAQNVIVANQTANQVASETAVLSQLQNSAPAGASSGPPAPPPPDWGPTDPPHPSLPPPEDPGPPALVGGHPELSNWEWGIWNDGTVQYFGNRYLGNTFLSSSDYQSIVNGSQVYDLVDDGGGQSAAIVHYGGANRLLQGTVNMQVQVGAAASPRWGGAFNLSNGNGDALSFSVDYASYGGTISSDGRLGLNRLASYSLSLNGGGTTFDRTSLSQQNISGQLIRPASGVPPINGAAGEFHFANSTAASVDGVFGVNLVPAAIKR